MIPLFLSLIPFLAGPALARESTDVIVMKNGDHITGQVKRLNGAILEVDLDYVDGALSVDWLKVARIESKGLFLIQLQDGSVYSGKVITPETVPGTPAKIEIQRGAGQKPLVVDKSAVVTMTQTSESFLQRFSGAVTLGASYSKGNSATQYAFGSELDYLRTRWGGRLRYDSNLAANAGAETSTRNQLDLVAYRLLRRNNYFYAGLASVLQSAVQGIQHQTTLGGGLGVFLKNTNRVRFSVLGGLGWQRTYYTESSGAAPQQDIGVALFSSTLQAFSFKKTRLNLTAIAAPALTDRGRVFSKTNMSYYVKLFGQIDWNLSFYGNWDNKPPPSFQGSDYGSSTGLSWTFGNK